MSSFSSNKTMNTATSCSLPEKIPNNAKNYICPRCNKFYDFQMAGNSLVGRIPLILNCKHTLCQECVYKMYHSKDIKCGECHTSNFITDIEYKKKSEQIFPVNYYILGVLVYHKRFGHDSSNINFKPAGYQFRQKGRGNDAGPQSFLNFNASQAKRDLLEVYNNFTVEEPKQVCSHCTKEAKVTCSDCDEFFCKQCSDKLHNSAKGLKKHKVVPISPNTELELTEKCKSHNSLIEVLCETCNENICIYCVLREHNGHKFYQFADMSVAMTEELKGKVDCAEDILKKLVISEKRIKNQLNKMSKPNNDASIDLTISRRIENAISKLQILESELLKEAHQYKNVDRDALLKLLENLTPNIRNVNNLVSVGKEVLQKKTQKSKKLNVALMIKQLEEIPNIPCYFVEDYQKNENSIEFSFDDSLIDDIQDSSKLKYSKTKLYTLVTKDELPEDYVEQDLDLDESTSMISSCSSLRDVVDKPIESVRPKRLQNKEQVEKWIRSTDKPQYGPNTAKEPEFLGIPSLQKGDKEGVKVSHLSSPECFYVQLNQLSPTLTRLEKNINRYIKATPIIPVKQPEINALYLVKYMSEQQIQWCRGRLIDELSDRQMYVVFFIDYGNTATVRKDDLMAISPEIKKLPPLALECKFFDLYPPNGEWSQKVLFIMTKIIANNDLLMIVIEREANKLAVDLINLECLTSVRDSLKFLGYGIPYCKQPTELDRLKKELKRGESIKLYSKTEQFKKEDTLEVILCYVIDPYNIYVNMKNSKDDLINLHKKMNTFYSTNKKGFIYAPKEDMVVAVNYTDRKSSSWRRGIVMSSSEGRGMVTVRLVDIGMVITIAWDQIRKLDPAFVSVDCQAILVKMTDIAPRNEENLWSQNAIDYFTKFIKAQTVLKMVVSETTNPPEVLLFECFPTVHTCLNAVLVKNGLAESTGDLSITVEWPQIEDEKEKVAQDSFTMSLLKTIQATTHETNTIDEIDSDDEDSNMFRKSIEIISAESPDLIYFRFTDLVDRLHEFQLEIRHFYENTRLVHSFWKIGDICVVSHKKQYYRAIIQEALPDKKFLVNLKDVAVTVEVKAKHIGVLDPKFMKDPEFALRCHLADITPAGGTNKWSAIACEYIQDIFKQHQRLYLAKKGANDKVRKSFSAVIWYVEFLPGGALESSKSVLHSINKLLLKNGLALKSAVPKSAKVSEEIKTDDNKDEKVEDSIENGDDASVKSTNTETEDHEYSSDEVDTSSVAGAVKPSTSMIDWNDLIEMQKQCPTQIIRDWTLPLPFKSNEFQAIPTFVNDDGHIFLHEIDTEHLLKEMEEKMFDYLETRLETEGDNYWNPGEMCSVNYHGNKKWYRGKILSVNESTIKVVMVDYGNEEDCEAKDLSKEILYYDLPIFANRVCLEGVYPKENKWLTSDLDILHAQIVEKKVTVTLKSQQMVGTPTPAEIKLGNLNINTFILDHSDNLSKLKRPLINTNSIITSSPLASLEISHDSILESSDADVIIEESSSSDENEVEDKFLDVDVIDLKYEQRPLPEIEPEKKLQIGIINLLNYNKLVIEIPTENFEQNKTHFEKLSKEINASISDLQNLEDFEVGTPCVAKYHEDGQWYRAQIIKDVDETKTCVWFVDFGNFEYINKESIKEVKEEWLEFPVEHHIATLDGIIVADEKNMDQILKEMVSYYGKLQLAEVTSVEPLKIKLYKVDAPNELSYQNLIDAGCLKVVEDLDETKRITDVEDVSS